MTGRTGRRLLVVMAKEPRAGSVKTRLLPLLAAEEAARLYRCFLEDRLEEMARLAGGVDRAVAFSPPSALPFFSRLCGSSYRLLSQGEGGLSERLVSVFGRGFAEGFATVCVIDSDSPDLPHQLVHRAFRSLEEGADAVFGPCLDGGYFLVGLGRDIPALFRGVPWSTPAVLDESLKAASRLGLRTALLPVWRDIDVPEDLEAFCRPWAPPPTVTAAPARRTRDCIERLRRDGVLCPPEEPDDPSLPSQLTRSGGSGK